MCKKPQQKLKIDNISIFFFFLTIEFEIRASHRVFSL